MKKILVMVVLGVVALASAQTATQPAQGQAAASSSGPVIKDPAEYNAYVGAVGQKDPAALISGLEAFVAQYPNSIMKTQALEILMATYQQTNNPKVMDTAKRLLAVSPDDAKALVVLSYSERAAQKWADAEQHAVHGLEVLPKYAKPEGVSDADFDKQKKQFATILNSIAGFSALQLKDFAAAQKYLRAAVEADPNNIENIYPLAVASLPPSTPPDQVNGLFFIARAVNLITDATAKANVQKFGHNKYVRYHGDEDGWNELLAQTASTPLPPPGFTIKPAPSPAEQAHKMVTDPNCVPAPAGAAQGDSGASKCALAADKIQKMDFATWEFVLTNGSQADQDAVWNAIKGQAMQMNGTVIGTTPSEFQIAGSSDDIDAKKADITLKFEADVPPKLIPKAEASLDFQGAPASYTPNPFMMVMEKGKLLKAAAPAPAKKPPVHRKPASQ